MNLEAVRVLLIEDNPADARYLREEIADAGGLTRRDLHSISLRRVRNRIGRQVDRLGGRAMVTTLQLIRPESRCHSLLRSQGRALDDQR